MPVQNKDQKDTRTISSETKKIFLFVFAVLATVGLFAVTATWKGKSVFAQIESAQLPLFRQASHLQQTTLDIVAIYYLLSGENDTDLQMSQMWRYDGLEADCRKTLQSISETAAELDDKDAAKSIVELTNNIASQFEDLNNTAREMMLANMNAEREAGKVAFGKLSVQIGNFRESVTKLESTVSATLRQSTGSAMKLLSGSNIVGIVITVSSVFVTMGLIRYLMSFLSVSLLPISNLMHNLRQSVFSVDRNGQVVSPVSKYSEAIFKEDIVGHSIDNLVLNHLGKTSEAYASARTAMTSVFGEDDMQWSLMEDNFPSVVRRTVGSEEKALKLTYTPLYNDQQVVQNVMIVAEDVTELERVKAEAAKKQAEVRILQGLIGVDRGDLAAFLTDTVAGLKQCNDLVSSMQEDLEARKLIFRTLHTIKGNSRLYNLMTISEVIHVTESAVVEINQRLDAKEPVGSEFYEAYLRGLRDSADVVAAHSKVANTMFGIEDVMAASRFRQVEELMWFLELGVASRNQPLFDAEALSAAGLQIQHAMVSIDPRWDKNLEQLGKLGHYFGSQEITESVDRLMVQAKVPDGDISDAFRNVQDCVFRFKAQSSLNRPYNLSFDSMVPVLNLLATLRKLFSRGKIDAADAKVSQDLVDALYERYLLTDAEGCVKFRHLYRVGLLALSAGDFARLNGVMNELTSSVAWFLSLEGSLALSAESRGKLAAIIPDPFEDIDPDALKEGDFADLLIGGLVETPKFGDISTQTMLTEFARSIGSVSVTDRNNVLLGDAEKADRMRRFFELIKGGIATDEGRTAVNAFVSEAETPAETALFNQAIASIGDRLHFMRTVASFGLGASEQADSTAAKTMEVTSDWFAKITEMAEQLQVAPKNSLESLHQDLQEHIASVFDYPLASLCGKMGPMVKDLTIKLGKNINYIVTGDPVALPRDQAYALRDALVHMLRNSLDHGIEMPSTRAAASKPEFATIEINCVQKPDNSIEISVIDDGAGVDIGKVKSKAVSMGAISAETASSMSDADALQLIFISRLSTKEEVSSLSGRGVGMDAVKAIIVDRMKGQIKVDSVKGGGTRFKMTTKIAKRREGASNLDEMSSFLLNAAKEVADCIDSVVHVNADQKVAQQIFRNLHTIKGNATLLGLKSVAEITHEAESQATALLGDNADAVKAAAVAIRVELAKLHGELLSQLQRHSKAQSGLGDEVGRFFATSSQEIAEILLKVETIFSKASFSDNALRVLHTMKSNASIHHQKDIEDKIHEIETAMVDILKSMNSGRKVEKEEVLSLHTRLKKLHDYLVTKLSGAKSKSEKSRDSNPAANVLESVRQTGGKIVRELGQIVSDADSAAMAFRDLHTLKGTASMNNLGKVVDALHRAESALDVICKRLADGRTGTPEQVSNFGAEMSAVCAVVERQLQGKVTSIGSKRKGGGSESELLMANLNEYLSQFAESGQTSFADADAITALFRELHTSKGNAEMLGLQSLVKVIHAAEDLVTALGDKIRAGEDDAALVQKLQGALGEVSAACATGPGSV